MKLFYQYMAIFFIIWATSNHLHPLQVENCDSNSRLVADEDDYDKLRIERVKETYYIVFCILTLSAQGSYLDVRQSLKTSKGDPHTERVNKL